MRLFPVFLSVVCVVRNQSESLAGLAREIGSALSATVSDYELILVDNGSTDDSVRVLRALTGADGEPNLQVYALTKEVDADTACWVGLENALGDFMLVIDPLREDISFLPTMLDHATSGADVVFATNQQRPEQGVLYGAAFRAFNLMYRKLGGIDLVHEAPHYRLLSKRVVNFILQHPQPAVSYRHLPATAGFGKANLTYSAAPRAHTAKHVGSGIDRAMRLLVSTTRAPMRLVTGLSLFGAGANLLYSIYVVIIALFKEDVAPGWTSLSLQQSGMFFLLSLVLLLLGEYMLNMASLSNEGPLYHVAQEFTSERLLRKQKLNVEDPASVASKVEAVTVARAV